MPVEYQMPVFVSMQPQMPLHVSVQENKVTKEVPVEKLVYVDKVCLEKTTKIRKSIISLAHSPHRRITMIFLVLLS